MENDPQSESNELSEKQLAALPYLVLSPSMSEAAARQRPASQRPTHRPSLVAERPPDCWKLITMLLPWYRGLMTGFRPTVDHDGHRLLRQWPP